MGRLRPALSVPLASTFAALAVLLPILACTEPEREDPVRDALERAAREHRLVVLDFYGKRCPPCARMDRDTWPDPEVRAELEHFVFVKVDTDTNRGAAQRFGVSGIPDVRVLDAEGRELGSARGFRSAEQIVTLLRRCRENAE